MSGYQVPPDGQPEYRVPVAASADGDGCPQCGSHAFYPNPENLLLRIPPHLQIMQCSSCGTRYRIKPKALTWRGLAHEWMVLLGIALVVAVLLLLIF
ncbi:MAG: hypothetical protein H0T53_11250 [Herpetosiphonaceae bacterium]|nr:hypothetical protein [Herpetosiphonaceae bacterium]